jgi:hypothetical protein
MNAKAYLANAICLGGDGGTADDLLIIREHSCSFVVKKEIEK